METLYDIVMFPMVVVFKAYLWGMETEQSEMVWPRNKEFKAYLWGMETIRRVYCIKRYVSLKPTYEEWKRRETTAAIAGSAV